MCSVLLFIGQITCKQILNRNDKRYAQNELQGQRGSQRILRFKDIALAQWLW